MDMDLSIDEKIQLVQKMRAEADLADSQGFRGQSYEGYGRSSYGLGSEGEDSRGTLGLRFFLAACLFGSFLLVQYRHMTIADRDAQDIVRIISEDSLSIRAGETEEK